MSEFYENLFLYILIEVTLLHCSNGTKNDFTGCGSLGELLNGRISPGLDTYEENQIVKFSCKEGYVLDGDIENKCLGNGFWKGELPICRLNLLYSNKMNTCGQSFIQGKKSILLDGRLDTCENEICQPNGNVILTVNLNESIKAENLNISIAVQRNDENKNDFTGCGSLGELLNGRISPGLDTYEENQIVKFSCKEGYVLDGEKENKCLGNGFWKGELPICRLNLLHNNKMNTSRHLFIQGKKSILLDGKLDTCENEKCQPNGKVILTVNLNESIKAENLNISISLQRNDENNPIMPQFVIFIRDLNRTSSVRNNLDCRIHFHYEKQKNISLWTAVCGTKNISGNELNIECKGLKTIDLCEVNTFIIKSESSICGKPAQFPFCNVVNNNETNGIHTVEYFSNTETILGGNTTRKCENGRWTGKIPVCFKSKCTTNSLQYENKRIKQESHQIILILAIAFITMGVILLITAVCFKRSSNYWKFKLEMNDKPFDSNISLVKDDSSCHEIETERELEADNYMSGDPMYAEIIERCHSSEEFLPNDLYTSAC